MTSYLSLFSLSNAYRIKEWATPVAVFFITALLSAGVIWHFDTMHVKEMRHTIQDMANENIFRLNNNINQIMALSYPLASTVHEDGKTEEFNFIAEKLLISYPLISEIALAPDGIITHVVPLKGNEKAIGLNLLSDPYQQTEALLARQSGKLTLAGPLQLVQGGEGLVSRFPVFIGKNKKFYGFVFIVIRFPEILHASALKNLTKDGYKYTLTRVHPKTKQLQIIAASGTNLDHPVETMIKLPNAQWSLKIAPADGWHTQHWLLALEGAIGVFISFLLGYVAKQYLELKNHRNTLERRIQERTSEILETKNHLHTLLDTIPDLIWLKNDKGVYLLCNPMFERFFGAKEEEIVGKSDYDFVEKELADFFRQNDRIVMESNTQSTNEEWVSFADDSHHALLETIKTPMRDEKGELLGVLGIARDITERHNHEKRIEQLSHLYAALSHCNKAIVRSSTPEELFQEVCKGIVSENTISMAWIGLIDPITKCVKPIASYGDTHHYLDGIEISSHADTVTGRGPTGISIRENRPCWCQDFLNDPSTAHWHERGKAAGWKASAALPFHLYGEVVGTFTVYSHKLNAFDTSSQELLVEMAMDISFAMENFDRKTNRAISEARLHQTEQLLEEMSAIAHIGGWEINPTTNAVIWTKEAAQIFDMDPTEPITIEKGLNAFHGEWREKIEAALDQSIHEAIPCDLELSIVTAKGRQKWIRLISTPIINNDGEVVDVHGSIQDITVQKTTEEKVHWLAHFDPLTGLPNRTLLNDRVDYAIHIADHNQSSLALLYIDLDHFKYINDTLGHHIGDEMLVQVASRIQTVLSEADTLSRQGGDEFMVLLSNADADDAAHVAEKLVEYISKPYQLQHHVLSVTLSIGIALYPIDGKNLTELSQAADAAMYRAKHDGRNCYRFFAPEIQERSARNLELENALRYALQNDQLELYYQPQLSIETRQLIGAEALLRWNHPTLGAISPSEFIPIAEESGQIISIGEWVLRQALGQLKIWIDEGMEPFIMAVNLSAIQFRYPNLVSQILGILDELQLPSHYLELELTERIASENPLQAIHIMNTLSDYGIRMSIDDFGTGYSSLNYLKKFRVYKLKIDQSFIRDIADNAEDQTIVNTIINMAHNLNMITIAEGVETIEQLDLLRKNGCKEVQGYYFSKPVPSEMFTTFVNSLSTTKTV